MELKEAKYILQERKSILINSSMPDISLVTAIDTVLEELNNRIPKEKILEFARRLEDIQDKEDEKLENFGFDLGGRQFIPVRNIVADKLRKILNKE